MTHALGKQPTTSISGEHPPATRFAISSLILPWVGGKLGHPTHQIHDIRTAGHFEVTERLRAATAQHLAKSIRLQGIDTESEAMLTLLDGLLSAGEIPHEEYFRRVENLFPHQMAAIDQSLKQRVSALSA